MKDILNYESLSENDIVNLINTADKVVLLIIPSLTVKIAYSIINSKVKCSITFATKDFSCNRTNEHFHAIKLLIENNITIKYSKPFAISTLMVDDLIVLFTMTPINNTLNSCQMVVDGMLSKLKCISGLEELRLKSHATVLKKSIMDNKVLKKLKDEQTEISLIHKLQNINFEFVELKFEGIRIDIKKISIPKELTNLGMHDEKVEEILSSSAKLLANNKSISKPLRKLEKRVKNIKDNYLVKIPHYGMLIDKNRKNEFKSILSSFDKDIEEVKSIIYDELKMELDKTEEALCRYYIPILKKTPSKKLLKSGYSPDDYLHRLFDKLFPRAETLLDKLKLLSAYKGITTELLEDDRFVYEIERHGINLYTDSDSAELY